MKQGRSVCAAVAAALLAASPWTAAHAASEQQGLEELRNTVVNLLQVLVDQGVMTRERAQQLVREAQEKAATDAAASAKADQGAVRVTYVPQVVRDEISRQVAQDVGPQLVDDVVARAKAERWGVPAALPDWLSRVRWTGDVRVRAQSDTFADDNLPQTQLNFLAINDAGGIDRAGLKAFANTTEDRYRLRIRARLGLEVSLGGGVTAGARLATGALRDPVSLNQTLGNYEGRFTTGLDLAYVRWEAKPATHFAFMVEGGRFRNPWYTTELLWDNDVNLDGVATTLRVPFGDPTARSNAYLTLGAHPIEDVELASKDKWLLAGQVGVDLGIGEQRLRAAAAYYDFRNVQGKRNAFDSTLLDYTAPQFLQRGNTLFDIRNDLAPDTNLFALAGKYEIVDAVIGWSAPVWNDLRFDATGHYIRNIGWKSDDVLRNAAIQADERTEGYGLELSLGHADVRSTGRWRAFFMYRYLQRDAALDAFADSNFRLGTDVKGYSLGLDLGLYKGTWMRLRYVTVDEIDGTLFAVGASQFPIRFPYGTDVVQLDVNASF